MILASWWSSWIPLGRFRGPFGRLEAILGRLGRLLESSWNPSSATLGRPGGDLSHGRSLAQGSLRPAGRLCCWPLGTLKHI
eukprot:7128446-Pyramimonas_sp.AAC.1